MHRKLVEPPDWNFEKQVDHCALCGRTIPASQRDLHHLIPKMKGGRITVAMHRICHRQIHALFSETELARHLNTPDALLAESTIRSFVDWVKTKPDGFFERTRRAGRRK